MPRTLGHDCVWASERRVSKNFQSQPLHSTACGHAQTLVQTVTHTCRWLACDSTRPEWVLSQATPIFASNRAPCLEVADTAWVGLGNVDACAIRVVAHSKTELSPSLPMNSHGSGARLYWLRRDTYILHRLFGVAAARDYGLWQRLRERLSKTGTCGFRQVIWRFAPEPILTCAQIPRPTRLGSPDPRDECAPVLRIVVKLAAVPHVVLVGARSRVAEGEDCSRASACEVMSGKLHGR